MPTANVYAAYSPDSRANLERIVLRVYEGFVLLGEDVGASRTPTALNQDSLLIGGPRMKSS